MIHVIDGNGKGKTTAAVGMAIRAAGHGRSVLFIQFLKDGTSGEIKILCSIKDITVRYSNVNYGFTFMMTKEQLKKTSVECNILLEEAITSDAFLLVLDEVIHALNAGLIDRKKLELILKKRCEVVLTGSDSPQWLKDKADYVTECVKIKHPYDKGVSAREGIEY